MLKNILVIAFMVALAELGCLLRSTALVVKWGRWPVFSGTMLGTAVAALVGIYLGVYLSAHLNETIIKWCAGLMLAGVGAWIILE